MLEPSHASKVVGKSFSKSRQPCTVHNLTNRLLEHAAFLLLSVESFH